MSDTLISPRADHSIRNRYNSFKRRNGPQNFRDILRQVNVKSVRTRKVPVEFRGWGLFLYYFFRLGWVILGMVF